MKQPGIYAVNDLDKWHQEGLKGEADARTQSRRVADYLPATQPYRPYLLMSGEGTESDLSINKRFLIQRHYFTVPAVFPLRRGQVMDQFNCY